MLLKAWKNIDMPWYFLFIICLILGLSVPRWASLILVAGSKLSSVSTRSAQWSLILPSDHWSRPVIIDPNNLALGRSYNRRGLRQPLVSGGRWVWTGPLHLVSRVCLPQTPPVPSSRVVSSKLTLSPSPRVDSNTLSPSISIRSPVSAHTKFVGGGSEKGQHLVT